MLQSDCGPASRLSIYDFILQLIPFSTEEAAFPGWYLILWQRWWWDPWGTNKWVSKPSVLLCWLMHLTALHQFLWIGLFTAANIYRCVSVKGSGACSDVKVLFCLFILHAFDAFSYPVLLHWSSLSLDISISLISHESLFSFPNSLLCSVGNLMLNTSIHCTGFTALYEGKRQEVGRRG